MGFLTSLFRAATPENPRFNLNDPAAWDSLGAVKSSSGIRVNRQTGLTYPPLWRAVNLLSRDVGKVPLVVMKKVGAGKDPDPKHPAYRLLRRKPCPEMGAMIFKQTLQAHALTNGNGYAYIFRFGDGTPRAVVPMDPDRTYPVRETAGDRSRIWYITEVNGDQRKLPPEDVLHIKGLGYDGIIGYDVVSFARECLGLGIALQKYGSIFFGNSARPNVVIEYPAKLNEKAVVALREGWERLHQGIEFAHRTAVLDNGAKAKELTVNARDSQLIEARAFSVRDVSNVTGVPPHKLADLSAASYNSLEQQEQAYLSDALDPWLATWEEECWDKLLTEEEKDSDSHEFLFSRKALIRADMTSRANYYRAAFGGPWMTLNEVRADEDLNPTDDGDDVPAPLNMSSGQPSPGEEDAPPKPGKKPFPPKKGAPEEDDSAQVDPRRERLRAALARTLEDAAGRMVRRIGVHARRAAADPKRYLAWLDEFRDEHQEVVADAIRPALEAVIAERGQAACDATWSADNLLDWIAKPLTTCADVCTASQLAAGVEQAMARLEAEVPAAFVHDMMLE